MRRNAFSPIVWPACHSAAASIEEGEPFCNSKLSPSFFEDGFDKKASSSTHVLQVPSLPREDTPLLGADHLSSQSKTFANVFIAIVGAGVFGLPYTFKKTGWLMGSFILFFVAFLTYHCMTLLVFTRQRLESLHGFSKINSFGDLGLTVCGPIGRAAVDVMIVLTQAGICISYLIYISNTLAYVFDSNHLILGLMPKTLYLWACFPFQLGLNSIPTLTLLAPLSLFADVVDLGTMGVVMVEDVLFFSKNRPVLTAFGGFSVLFYGLGVAVYSFEGSGMVLPLESEAKYKDKFGKVLGYSMAFISVNYWAFGILGYLAFGEETNDIITTNIETGWISILVQIGLCINLFFTFPLMTNPVYEVGERLFCNSRYCLWLRWVMVFVVSVVVLLVPNFADFLSLVGSRVCCMLGFVLPASFHLIVFKGQFSLKVLILDGYYCGSGFGLGCPWNLDLCARDLCIP